jgi:integrase
VGKTNHLNFTKKALEKLPSKETRYNVFDDDVSGLGIAVHPSGVKTLFHVKKVRGWPQRTTIGPFPDLSVEQARGKASELNGKLAKWRSDGYEGQNPLERPTKVSTLGEVLTHYIEHHLKRNAKNPDHAVKYAHWQFDSYLASWRNRPLATISRADVVKRHAEITSAHGGVTANRSITFLRTLFGHAIDPDVALWDGLNPARKLKKILNHETPRKTVLEDSDAKKFFKALECEPHRDLRDFILIALSTAARRGTIFAMEWSQIDFDRGLWVIPNPKGRKGQEDHVVPLNKLAVSVLKGRPRVDGSPWVFPGRRGHIMTVKKPWSKFLERAGINDFHVHDMRRSVATRAGESGATTEVIKRTLGHSEDSVATKIYDRSDRRGHVLEAIDAAVTSMLLAGKSSKRKLLGATRHA